MKYGAKRVFTKHYDDGTDTHRRKRKRKPIRARPPRQNLTWSPYQEAIFRDVESGDGHTIVQAAPGSGKTATIKESTYRVPDEYKSSGEVLCCAFNKDIATKLERELPSTIHCSTFHKIGFRTVQQNWGPTFGINGYSVDKDDLIAEELSVRVSSDSDSNSSLRKNLIMAMKLAKATLSVDMHSIEAMCYDHGIKFCKINPIDFAERVMRMIAMTADSPGFVKGKAMISFDDMLYLPWHHGWKPVRQYARVFVDEAQDLSAAREHIVLGCISEYGRLAAYGDPFQAIYSFAGSTSNIMSTLEERLGAKQMPLSVSYRLPKSVIALAKKFNPAIEAAENAIDGVISYENIKKIHEFIRPGDCIISRTNFPLIQTCFYLVKKNIRANIRGRDIGKRFLWRIECWQSDTIEKLKRDCNAWADEVIEMLTERNRPIDKIIDERDSILAFANNSQSVTQCRELIDQFFTDDTGKDIVLLSTAHKAKGLEWDRVCVLKDTFKQEEGDEEANVWYVAITRPKKELIFADGKMYE